MIRKLDFAPHRNDHQRGLKTLVLLHQLRNVGGILSWRFDGRSDGGQPDYRSRSVREWTAILDEVDVSLQRFLSRRANGC